MIYILGFITKPSERHYIDDSFSVCEDSVSLVSIDGVFVQHDF